MLTGNKVTGKLPKYAIAIYNRWRERLYSSIGYSLYEIGFIKRNLLVGTNGYIINLKIGVILFPAGYNY